MIPACIVSGVVSVVSFFLYIRYRMRPRAEEDVVDLTNPVGTIGGGDTGNAELERKEQRYQQIHFISLALFVLFGVLILVYLSHLYNPARITY